MGFLDSLGSALGSVAGNLAEQGKLLREIKNEYESWSNYDLKVEYNKWNSRNSQEARLRKGAIRSILEDRGITK